MEQSRPLVSVVTPTLNAGKVLADELKSIREQDYPQDKIEIIIADGGSTDNTHEVAKKYNASIYPNPLKTAEAGKAVGVKKAKGKYIALIDSDNILPDKNWLKDMIPPLEENPDIVGSEPWLYTYRKEGGFIERYSALIGANDPIVIYYGNYDRLNTVTNRWTEIPLEQKDHGNWIEVILEKDKEIPTIGANGTIFRTDFLKQADIGDYLFDIDILVSEVQRLGSVKFAKVKTGIIHTFCESNISKFARKQKRRVLDYYYYKSKGLRNVNWNSNASKKQAVIKFAIHTVLIIPTLFYALKGYSKKKDNAWFFHPLACIITLWQYTVGTLNSLVTRKELNRDNWKQ